MASNSLSLIPLLLLFILSFCVAIFSAAVNSLKSHRIGEKLQALSGYFFYWDLHHRLLGKGLSRLKTCLNITKALLQYSFVAYGIIYLASTSILTSYVNRSWPVQLVWFIAVIVFCLLTVDTLPRSFAMKWPQFFLRFSSLPTSIACTSTLWLTLPLIKLIEWQGEIDESPYKDPTFEVREKMMEILHDFESARIVDWQNRTLLHGIIKYQDRIVREIMVPRVEIFCLPASTRINDAAAMILREGYTRIPVYEDSIDHILGVIMAKDLLKTYLEAQERSDAHMANEATIASLVKPVLYTPESKRISALLQEFRKRHVHLAIVVDEYGGTEGLVTIEDILEEIVGDIEDEYDLGEKPFTLLSDGSYLVDAHISVLDLNENLGLNIPTDGDYDTLSGYIFSKLGSIPSQGLIIHQNDFDLEVIDCSERSVEKVRVRIHPSSP